nr:MAG TPA_asm: hypothetical protein [Caudoviricetes sp.]
MESRAGRHRELHTPHPRLLLRQPKRVREARNDARRVEAFP